MAIATAVTNKSRSGDDAGGVDFCNFFAYACCIVVPLHHQPAIATFAAADLNKPPVTDEPLALQLEFELSLLQRFVQIAVRSPMAAIPNDYFAGTVLTCRNRPFEFGIFERMVFDGDREPFFGWVEAGTLGNCPTLQHAIEFQTKIVMQPRRCVFLDNKAQRLREPSSFARPLPPWARPFCGSAAYDDIQRGSFPGRDARSGPKPRIRVRVRSGSVT